MPSSTARRSSACLCALQLIGVTTAVAQVRPDDSAVRARRLARQLELPEQRLVAARELVGLGSAAAQPLRSMLGDPRPDVVAAALWVCAGIDGGDALAADIEPLLHSQEAATALAAMRTLGLLGASGRTIVADYQAGAVLAIEPDGTSNKLFEAKMAMSCVRLPDGHLLVAAYGDDRIVELDGSGREVWTFAGVSSPSHAQRLPNGNTLIADSANTRAIEVTPAGAIVWQYADDVRPIDVERLGNGNTLIGSFNASGAIEVDPKGLVVWRFADGNVRDVDRLVDGTTLLVLTDQQRVVVVDRDGKELRQWKVGFAANEAELLPDGNLLVAGEGTVAELDQGGATVWQQALKYAGHGFRCGRRAPTAPAAAGRDH